MLFWTMVLYCWKMPKVLLFASSSFDWSISSNVVYEDFRVNEMKFTVKSCIKETVLRNYNLNVLKGGETKGKNTIILAVISKNKHGGQKAVKIVFEAWVHVYASCTPQNFSFLRNYHANKKTKFVTRRTFLYRHFWCHVVPKIIDMSLTVAIFKLGSQLQSAVVKNLSLCYKKFYFSTWFNLRKLWSNFLEDDRNY